MHADGYVQDAIAAAVAVDQSTISRERGRPPRMDTDPALRRNSTRQLLTCQPHIDKPLERPHRTDGRDETLRG